MNNPYSAPQSLDFDKRFQNDFDWRSIPQRWERYRIIYNLAVGLAGLCGLIFSFQDVPTPLIPIGIAAWAIGANAMFFLGPAAELYLCWLGIRSESAPWILFVLGTGFATLFTLAAALSPAAIPDQL